MAREGCPACTCSSTAGEELEACEWKKTPPQQDFVGTLLRQTTTPPTESTYLVETRDEELQERRVWEALRGVVKDR